ncbi:MAG: hypothetical protein LBD53_05260 [Tannerella sp.]|jgi:glycerophosphoryl diester phosphodiesterase|nr:hypothetical protein [Tannerella sp.]
MKKFLIIALTAGLASLLASCGEDDKKNPEVSLDTYIIVADVQGATKTITVKSESSWLAAANESWVKTDISEGTNGSITITVEPNTLQQDRKSQLSFYVGEIVCANVIILQNAYKPSLSIAYDNVQIGENGGTVSFQIASNGEAWDYTNSGDAWLTETEKTATSLTLTAPANTGAGRLTFIRFKLTDYPDKTWDVTITQDATIVDNPPVFKTKVIAHRGHWNISGSAQNSIKSLEEAQKLNIYGSEFDVWITTDGRVILNHDASFGGVTIQTSTYDQVKNLKLANGETMPTLEDYLEQGKKSSTKLILEIKTHSTRDRNNAVTEECIRLVNAAGMTNMVEYIAFDLENCKKILQLQPNAIVAYLNGDRTPAQLHELGIKGLDYTFSILNSSHPEWVKQAHDLGMTVNIWTVNSASDLNNAILLGVDFITTDNPVLAKQLTE